jgi:hypothetical protein
MAIDFLGAQGGALAISAFMSGSFVAGIMWKFIVVPLREEKDTANKELKDRLISELEFYRQLEEAKRSV